MSPADRKTRILDAAERLFGEQGYGATSQRDIINAAGVNLAAIHYYFRSKDEVAGDMRWQQERFRNHIRAARAVRKPLIIHTREAAVDTIRLMREESAHEAGGVMHCFTESWDVATQALDLGFYISISGIVTFRNAEALRDVAKKVPKDRLLVETDSPYLAPVPHRGKANEPAFVRHVAECVAELRGVSFEALAEQTTQNFFNLFQAAGRS